MKSLMFLAAFLFGNYLVGMQAEKIIPDEQLIDLLQELKQNIRMNLQQNVSIEDIRNIKEDLEFRLRLLGHLNREQVTERVADILEGASHVSLTFDSKRLLLGACVKRSNMHDKGFYELGPRLYDLKDLKSIRRFSDNLDEIEVELALAILSSDGNWALFGYEDGTVRIWDLGKLPKINAYEFRRKDVTTHSFVESAAINNGRYALIGLDDGQLKFLDLKALPTILLSEFSAHARSVRVVLLSSDGQKGYTESVDEKRLWDLSNPKKPYFITLDEESFIRAISNDGCWCVAEISDEMQIWNIENVDKIQKNEESREISTSSLYCCMDEYKCSVEERLKKNLIRENLDLFLPACYSLKSNASAVKAATISLDRKWVLIRDTMTTSLWKVKNRIKHERTREAFVSTSCVSFTPDGRNGLDWLSDNNPRRIALKTLWSKMPDDKRKESIGLLCSSLDGMWVLGSEDGASAKLFHLAEKQNPRLHYALTGERDKRITALALSLDARFAALGYQNGVVRVYQLYASTNDISDDLSCHQKTITRVTFSPRAKWVVTESSDGDAMLCYVKKPHKIIKHKLVIAPLASSPLSLSFSNDDKWLLTSDGKAKLWKLDDPKHVFPMELDGFAYCQTKAKPTAVALSSRGNKGIIGYEHGALRLWNFDDLGHIIPFKLRSSENRSQHKAKITSVSCAEDFKWLLAADESGTVRLWDLSKFYEPLGKILKVIELAKKEAAKRKKTSQTGVASAFSKEPVKRDKKSLLVTADPRAVAKGRAAEAAFSVRPAVKGSDTDDSDEDSAQTSKVLKVKLASMTDKESVKDNKKSISVVTTFSSAAAAARGPEDIEDDAMREAQEAAEEARCQFKKKTICVDEYDKLDDEYDEFDDESDELYDESDDLEDE